MTDLSETPKTFVDLVLAFLEERFPWLGKTPPEEISGADTIQDLNDLHEGLKEARDAQIHTEDTKQR